MASPASTRSRPTAALGHQPDGAHCGRGRLDERPGAGDRASGQARVEHRDMLSRGLSVDGWRRASGRWSSAGRLSGWIRLRRMWPATAEGTRRLGALSWPRGLHGAAVGTSGDGKRVLAVRRRRPRGAVELRDCRGGASVGGGCGGSRLCRRLGVLGAVLRRRYVLEDSYQELRRPMPGSWLGTLGAAAALPSQSAGGCHRALISGRVAPGHGRDALTHGAGRLRLDVPDGRQDLQHVGRVDFRDRPATDAREGVPFEAPPPVLRVPPAASPATLRLEHALGGFGEGGNALCAALLGEGGRPLAPGPRGGDLPFPGVRGRVAPSPPDHASLRLARASSRALASGTSAAAPSPSSRRRPRMTSRWIPTAARTRTGCCRGSDAARGSGR